MGGVTVSDACSGAGAITLSQLPAVGTLVGLGTHTITVTATDAATNSATCTTTFTVSDTTAPTVVCSAVPGASADGNCQAAVPNVMGGVSVSDACSAAGSITLSQSPAAGTLVGLGTHTITVTATDAATNSATCTTTFTVTDTTAPSVVCSAVAGASADGNCQAAVFPDTALFRSSDACSGAGSITLSQSPAAGTLVGLGTHTITVTATDAATNSATCTTTFMVSDTTAPSVVCSAVAGASADGNCQAAVGNAMGRVSVSDACSGAGSITLSQSPAAGTLVGLGTHTITVTATDAATNSATCTTTFTVSDTPAPIVVCSAVPGVGGGVRVSEACSCAGSITLSQSPAAGTLVGLGTHTSTVTATDSATNSATCTTTFTVSDTPAPSVVCSGVPGASADGNCQAAVPNVMGGVSVSDACSGAGAITLSQSPAAGTLVGLEIGRASCREREAATESAACTKTFTVSDTTAPSVVCSAGPGAS